MTHSHSAVTSPGPRTYMVAAGTAVEALRLLTPDGAGGVEHAGATSDVLGQAENAIPADAAQRPRGGTVSVRPLTPSNGGRRFIASAAIVAGAKLGKAADGKVVTGTTLGYIALSAAGAADEIIEAVPFI